MKKSKIIPDWMINALDTFHNTVISWDRVQAVGLDEVIKEFRRLGYHVTLEKEESDLPSFWESAQAFRGNEVKTRGAYIVTLDKRVPHA